MTSLRIRSTLTAALVATLVACGGGGSGPPALEVLPDGTSTFNPAVLGTQLAGYALQAPLSAAETASLLFMREEEQLAHDVYVASAARWPQPIFANIATSESTHAAAVAALLSRYAIPDPMAGLPTGRFASASFQALYEQLVAASAQGLVPALQVGLQIEELDIRDIEAQKTGIDNADILMVYDNLLRGSRNHLRAFWKLLQAAGGSYTPQYITQAAFDAIVGTPVETGP